MDRMTSENAPAIANAQPVLEAETAQRNGSARTPPAVEETRGDEKSSVDRVEEMMDQAGHKVGKLTSKVGQGMFRFLAHVREALEDCWAEAQSIRRGEKNDPPAV
jgi:hypothetical protein